MYETYSGTNKQKLPQNFDEIPAIEDIFLLDYLEQLFKVKVFSQYELYVRGMLKINLNKESEFNSLNQD